MDQASLQQRIRRGLSIAGRFVGTETEVYRPSGYAQPLAAGNRVLRLGAAFSATDGRFGSPNGYGDALWYGLFDTSQTQPGDYLVQPAAVWFIAAQQPLMPVLCVQANRTVSFSRPAAPRFTGANSYGGVTPANSSMLLDDWPASVTGASGQGHQTSGLPSDSTVPYWTVLLPATPGLVLHPSDLMTDDLGRNAVVAAAELSDLGWRIAVKQATT